ncbi:MAG: aromatic-ring-hydroxylating dioxygenase subunit beta [Cycloclasticus sp.]|nr:aromatic-ring-hydroxylating dioxygenase subunit beta [Cycloclasticus sp.]
MSVSNDVQMTRAEAEDFLFAEAMLLDQGKLQDWQQLFTDDALYWLPYSRDPDIDPKKHVSILYDDMELLDERIKRIQSGACHAQIPGSRTLHTVNNVRVKTVANEVVIESYLTLHEYRSNRQDRFYPLQTLAANCEHRLVKHDGEWKMTYKKVVLLNCDGEIYDLSFLI